MAGRGGFEPPSIDYFSAHLDWANAAILRLNYSSEAKWNNAFRRPVYRSGTRA